jgi:hypothetical protein
MKQETHDSEKQKAVANTISEYGVAGDNNLTACKWCTQFFWIEAWSKNCDSGNLGARFGRQFWGTKIGCQSWRPESVPLLKMKRKWTGQILVASFSRPRCSFGRPFLASKSVHCRRTVLLLFVPRPLSSLQLEIRLSHETRMKLVNWSSYIEHALCIACCALLQDVTEPELQRQSL